MEVRRSRIGERILERRLHRHGPYEVASTYDLGDSPICVVADHGELIRERLQALAPDILEIGDESHLHRGHAGNTGGGHYAVLVVSRHFEGVSRLNRQKTVKSLLKDLFADGMIHALGIRAATPDEYFHTAD